MTVAQYHLGAAASVAPTPRLDLSVTMEMRVSPAQLLLSELLPLAVVGLEARLSAELDANGALELPEPSSCPGCGRPVWRGRCLRCAGADRTGREDPVSQIRDGTSARDELLRNVVGALGPEGRRIARHLVADIDGYGVLDEPLLVIANRLGVAERAVRETIAAMRSAGFPGLCAGSVEECIRLQVEALAVDCPVPLQVRALLGAGLPALASGPPANAAAVCGLDAVDLGHALGWLRAHLSLPLLQPTERASPQPVDVVVRLLGDRLTTAVVAGPWSALRVADSYREQAADPAISADIGRASRFIETLGRRERALELVGTAAVSRQSARVRQGPRAHRALTRRTLAAELGLHESTVSRVVAGKYVSLPTGETVALASLFGAESLVQDCLRQLVGAEQSPLSDASLAVALAQRGHLVARRTVAKYRIALGIPDAGRR